MSQESIIQHLIKHRGRKFTTKELSKRLKLANSTVNTCTLKLRKRKALGIDKQLCFKQLKNEGYRYFLYWWRA